MTIGSMMRAGPRCAVAALLACVLSAAAAAPALAGTWLAPVDLSKPLRSANNPSVAMDEVGRTVAIWERDGKTPFETTVQASVRGLGGQFSEPIDLSLPAYSPEVAMTPSGEAVATWWHSQGGKYVLQISRRPPDGGFSPPVEVAEVLTGSSPPATNLAVGPSGEAALAWLEENAEGNSAVMVAAVPTGSPPSQPVEVSDPEHDALPPRVAVAPDGHVSVAWSGFSSEESPSAVLLSTGSTDSFSSPIQVSTADAVGGPQLELDAAGEPTLVWEGFEEKPEEDWEEAGIPEFFPAEVEARTSVGGSFGPVAVLADYGEEAAVSPRLAISSGDTALVVWVRKESGSSSDLEAVSRPSSADAFSAPEEVAHEDLEIRSPDLAVNAAGGSIAAWHNAASSSHASIRTPGGSFGAPVDFTGGQTALFPQVAINGSGDAVAVWRGSDGANQIARAAGFDASPPELRNLSVPAAGTVGEPVALSVEPFDVWPLASVGFDFGDGGSAAGASVSHVYGTPGSYLVTASATDSTGASTSAAGSITILASNDFRLGRLKRNKRTGRATLIVHVPGPGGLALRGRGVKRAFRRARAAGALKLPVRAVGGAAKRLRKSGKVKVRLRVVFSPDSGRPASRVRAAVLKKTAGRRQHRR